MHILTQEQQEIVDTICSSQTMENIIAVNAVAGSGKTSTCKAIVDTYKPKKGFYTAFNKAIVLDSNKKFNGKISAKTIHALAYQYIKPKGKIEDLNYSSINENINYNTKYQIINILDDFYRSNSINIYEFVQTQTDNINIQNLVTKYANLMLQGEISPTFNYMLKCLHIMLYNKDIQIDFDLLIYDEAQDIIPVTLEIFKLMNANHKIILGDKFQNIYSFMNTVNAFEELNNLQTYKLTKSFRCNPFIANTVHEFGTKYLDKEFLFKGNTDIPYNDIGIAYISRTNAILINRMYELLQDGESFTLIRDIKEIFSLPIALLNASVGRPVYEKQYKFLETEYEKYNRVTLEHGQIYDNYFSYLNTIMSDDISIVNTIKLLTRFQKERINIYNIKDAVISLKPNPHIILSTAHAFKGLEMNTVYIEDDLNNSVNKTITSLNNGPFKHEDESLGLTKEQKEDLNTYYVALSRAKNLLINDSYFKIGEY